MKKARIGLALLGAIALTGLTPMLVIERVSATAPGEHQDKDAQKFHGKVEAVDAAAKTLTVGGKLIYTTDTTLITKEGKAIKLDKINVGDEVHGTTRQNSEGKVEALTVTVGKEKEE
jgi:hypothetical protein